MSEPHSSRRAQATRLRHTRFALLCNRRPACRLSPRSSWHLWFCPAQTPNATETPTQAATRIIEGHVTNGQGAPVHEGKVMFARQAVAFFESWTAAIDAEGHYRIELSPYRIGNRTIPTAGVLRYLVLVPGFRSAAGTVGAIPPGQGRRSTYARRVEDDRDSPGRS